jgi:hypothetical protein
VDLQGTFLLPQGAGVAKVRRTAGGARIRATFKDLPPPSRFGGEYLTYVLWGIATDGQAANLGEIVPQRGKAVLQAVEPLQTFALVVTAEPDFAVSQPSDAEVLENAAQKAALVSLDTGYVRLRRRQYTLNLDLAAPGALDDQAPSALHQARNAVRLARAAGAPVFAAAAMAKAEMGLLRAESETGENRIPAARACVLSAEAARQKAIQRQATQQVAMDQAQVQDRVDATDPKPDLD